jgi:hypothetical protein
MEKVALGRVCRVFSFRLSVLFRKCSVLHLHLDPTRRTSGLGIFKYHMRFRKSGSSEWRIELQGFPFGICLLLFWCVIVYGSYSYRAEVKVIVEWWTGRYLDVSGHVIRGFAAVGVGLWKKAQKWNFRVTLYDRYSNFVSSKCKTGALTAKPATHMCGTVCVKTSFFVSIGPL